MRAAPGKLSLLEITPACYVTGLMGNTLLYGELAVYTGTSGGFDWYPLSGAASFIQAHGLGLGSRQLNVRDRGTGENYKETTSSVLRGVCTATSFCSGPAKREYQYVTAVVL